MQRKVDARPKSAEEVQLNYREAMRELASLQEMVRARVKTLAEGHEKVAEAKTAQHLSSALIKDSDIPGIGPAERKALEHSNILSAQDVLTCELTRAYGIGRKRRAALIQWAERLHDEILPSYSRDLSPEDLDKLWEPFEAQRLTAERLAREVNQLQG